jgi:hypothetical protein
VPVGELCAALRQARPRQLVAVAIRSIYLRTLQRLLAGRGWIGLVAFALIGIVTMQLGLLKLNGSIGRALEREATLQRENATLSVENSQRSAGDRVQLAAARIGMEPAPPGTLRFVVARPTVDASRAAVALREAGLGAPSVAGEGSSSLPSSGPAQAESPTSSSSPARSEQAITPAGGSPATSAAQAAPAGQEGPAGEGAGRAQGTQAPASAPQAANGAASTGTPAPGAPASGGGAEASPAGETSTGARPGR